MFCDKSILEEPHKIISLVCPLSRLLCKIKKIIIQKKLAIIPGWFVYDPYYKSVRIYIYRYIYI